MVVSSKVHSRPHNPDVPASFSFRCPSCLNVLTVDPRLVSSAAPCPLCGARIIAPKPITNGIPFATLVGTQISPFMPVTPETESNSPQSKIVLVDGGISQSHLNRKDTMATIKMIVFAILTAGICLIAAWWLLSS